MYRYIKYIFKKDISVYEEEFIFYIIIVVVVGVVVVFVLVVVKYTWTEVLVVT